MKLLGKVKKMPVEVQTLEPLDFFMDLNLDELNEFASLLNPRP